MLDVPSLFGRTMQRTLSRTKQAPYLSRRSNRKLIPRNPDEGWFLKGGQSVPIICSLMQAWLSHGAEYLPDAASQPRSFRLTSLILPMRLAAAACSLFQTNL